MAFKVNNAYPLSTVVEIFNHPNPTAVLLPRIGLGVFQASPNETEQAVRHALQEGYRHIDTAQLYRNEGAVGKAIRESGIPRNEIFVTSKLWNSDHGYENTLQAFEQSLSRLGLDYVDLYLVHSPMRIDQRIETWKAMEFILTTKKVKSIGVSNYGIHHLQELFENSSIRPSVNQIELHPYCTRTELVHFCQKNGIVLQAYSPLTKGRRLKDVQLVEHCSWITSNAVMGVFCIWQLAGRYKKTPAQVMIRWGLQKGFVVLPKSVNPLRISSNAQVFDFEISNADMAKMDSWNENYVTGWDPTIVD